MKLSSTIDVVDGDVESRRGRRSSCGRGQIQNYEDQLRLRGQVTGVTLTLVLERGGKKEE